VVFSAVSFPTFDVIGSLLVTLRNTLGNERDIFAALPSTGTALRFSRAPARFFW
jgi:hypothetical protein